jgi:hypothetical protein
MADIVVLDTTKNGGEKVLVLVNGEMVYAEDHFDNESMNCTYDAMYLANALSKALGCAEPRVVIVHEDEADLSFEELTGWFAVSGGVKRQPKRRR